MGNLIQVERETKISCYLFMESCYQTVKVAYFHGPLAMLLTINLVLFLSSAYSLLFGIWAIPREDSSTSSRGSRQMFWIVLELFLVLGLTWLADVISLLLNWANGSAHVTFEVFVFDVLLFLHIYGSGHVGLFVEHEDLLLEHFDPWVGVLELSPFLESG